MNTADSVPCRDVTMTSPVVAVFGLVAFVLLTRVLLALATGALWWLSIPLGLAMLAWLFVLLSSGWGAAYVIELVDGGILIRQSSGWYQRFRRDRVVTAASVNDGYLVGPAGFVLGLRGGRTVEAKLAAERARDVLDHLGVTLEQRALSAPLSGAFEPAAWLEALILLAAVGAVAALHDLLYPLVGFLLVVAIALATVLAFSRRLRPHAVVGLDGVRIVGALRSRFVPHSAIDSVTRVGPRGSRIVLATSAGDVALPCIDTSDEQIAALVSRIEEGRAAAAATQSPPLELLERRGRALDDWRAAVSELALGGKGFRGAALCEEDSGPRAGRSRSSSRTPARGSACVEKQE